MKIAVVSLCLIGATLVGLQTNNSVTSQHVLFTEAQTNEMIKIELVNLQTSPPIQIKTFTDRVTIQSFELAVKTAKIVQGIPKMRKPDYQMTFVSNNGKKVYNLWLKSKSTQASLMDKENSHELYTLTEDATALLKDILLDEELNSESR